MPHLADPDQPGGRQHAERPQRHPRPDPGPEQGRRHEPPLHLRLPEALAASTVSVITCPVDYSENLRLTGTLGDLTGPF
jgi:hypothetical protein